MHELNGLFDAMHDEATIVELVSARVALVALVLEDAWPGELVDAVDDLEAAVALLRREDLGRSIRAAIAAHQLGLGPEPTLGAMCVAAGTTGAEQLRYRGACLADSLDGLQELANATSEKLHALMQAARRGALTVVVEGHDQHERLDDLLDQVVPQSLAHFLR